MFGAKGEKISVLCGVNECCRDKLQTSPSEAFHIFSASNIPAGYWSDSWDSTLTFFEPFENESIRMAASASYPRVKKWKETSYERSHLECQEV
jgi:hypothetical protein